jgi:exodeoxyribonuclease VII small subunit
MKKTGKYSDVLRELEETLEKMNRGDVPIDELEDTVKGAAKKIQYLRQVLRSTQQEVTKILKDIEDDQGLTEEA